jgi:hypothetical protein
MLGEAGRPITRGRVVPPIETNDMLLVFNRAVNEVALGQKMIIDPAFDHEKDIAGLNRALVIALHLACLLSRLIFDDDCAEDVKQKILSAIYDLVKLKVRPKIAEITSPAYNFCFFSSGNRKVRTNSSPSGMQSRGRSCWPLSSLSISVASTSEGPSHGRRQSKCS